MQPVQVNGMPLEPPVLVLLPELALVVKPVPPEEELPTPAMLQ
jgi:hypothetical protein